MYYIYVSYKKLKVVNIFPKEFIDVVLFRINGLFIFSDLATSLFSLTEIAHQNTYRNLFDTKFILLFFCGL